MASWIGRSRQRGGEIVEFAMTLPLILLLFFGIVELSVGFFDQAILTGACRAAAREAVRASPPGGDMDTWNPAAEAEAAARAAARRMFSWSGAEALGFEVTPDPLSADDGDPVRVTLTYRYRFNALPRFMQGGIADINLTAVSVMRSLRTPPTP